jgi:hypothetical protein
MTFIHKLILFIKYMYTNSNFLNSLYSLDYTATQLYSLTFCKQTTSTSVADLVEGGDQVAAPPFSLEIYLTVFVKLKI